MTSDIDDVLGMQPPESDPERLFEADWTDEGAVCTEAFARLHGALLVNRSRS